MQNFTMTRGFSLIEVLISAFVLGIGLLGVGGLMTRSIQSNTSAIHRTQAVQFSYEIIDRIRSNDEANYAIALDAPPPNAQDCEGGNQNCSENALRSYDLAEWKCSLGKFSSHARCKTLVNSGSIVGLDFGLPNGDGSIESVASGNQTLYTVTVSWLDTRDLDAQGNPSERSFSVSTKL